MNYFTHSRQENTKRTIEPVGMFYLDNYWHLIAFCRMRHDYRDFRMDRISALCITSESFMQKHPSLKDYMEQLCNERDIKEVVIAVDKKIYPYLDEQKYYNGFISEKISGDGIEMSFFNSIIRRFCPLVRDVWRPGPL